MPSPSIVWDLIEPGDIVNTRQGTRITRGLMVKDLAPVMNATYGTDPGLLSRCFSVTGFPQINDSFPGSPYLTVQEQRLLKVVNKTYSVKFAITYEGFNEVLEPQWVVQEDFNVSYIQTSATSGGKYPLTTFYQRGKSLWPREDGTDNDGTSGDLPAGAEIKAGTVHKMRSGRVIRAIANMATAYYLDHYAVPFRNLAGKINADPWQGFGRGQLYFTGPKTTTRNAGTITQAVIDLIVEPLGHYPVLAYYNRLGQHPSDCAPEAFLRYSGAVRAPDPDNLLRANGLTLCSVYEEDVFNGKLPFTVPTSGSTSIGILLH